SQRVRTKLTATIELPDGLLVCPTRDISDTGCFLATADVIATGTWLVISVMNLQSGEAITVHGVVVRQPGPADQVRGVGVSIPQPPDAWLALVQRHRDESGLISVAPAV